MFGNISAAFRRSRQKVLKRHFQAVSREFPKDAGSRSLVELLEARVLLSAVLYVDPIAPGPGHNGSSWMKAVLTLQQALSVAVSGETIEVAQGTYTPTSGTDRTATFQLIDGVTIEGGFAGYGTANPDARDVAAYPTILSGDIGVVGNNADNSYHVVTGSGTNSTAVLDGFTITAGNADGSGNANSGYGAGMFDIGGNPTINNCSFNGNTVSNPSGYAYGYGGGMYNSGSSPTLTNCTFSGNMAATNGFGDGGYGGGMYNSASSSPTLTNCTFNGNTVSNPYNGGYGYGGYGGGMYNSSSSPILSNCTFRGNGSAGQGGSGGGMYNSSSSPILTNCTFSGNAVSNPYGSGGGLGNGGAIYNYLSSPVLTNCTFNGNAANTYVNAFGSVLNGYGGAMYNSVSSPTLTNCILWGDLGVGGYGLNGSEIYLGSGAVVLTYSDIQGGLTGKGNINTDPQFVNSAAGNLALQPTSPCINVGSNATIEATGVTTDIAGNPRIFDGVVDMGAYEAQAVTITWTGNDDGVSWNDPLNWSDNLVPDQNDTVAIPGGFPVVQVGGGAFTVGAVNSSSPLEILSGGSLQLFGSAVLNAALTIDNGGTLDIQNNTLTINYAAGSDPAATIRGYLKSAYNGGVWTGAGLTSSTVEAQIAYAIKNPGGGVYAIGYEDGSADVQQAVAVGNQLVIEPAIVGDTDLNGSTNFLDLGRLAQNLGAINADWQHGDFNYDGSVSFLDIGLLAQNLSKTTINTPLGAEVSGNAAVVVSQSVDGKPSTAIGLSAPRVVGAEPTNGILAAWPSSSPAPVGLFSETLLDGLLA